MGNSKSRQQYVAYFFGSERGQEKYRLGKLVQQDVKKLCFASAIVCRHPYCLLLINLQSSSIERLIYFPLPSQHGDYWNKAISWGKRFIICYCNDDDFGLDSNSVSCWLALIQILVIVQNLTFDTILFRALFDEFETSF